MEVFMKKTITMLLLLSSLHSTHASYDIDAIFNEMERQFQESAHQLHQFFDTNKSSINKGLTKTRDVADKIQTRLSSYNHKSLTVNMYEDAEKKEYHIETPVPGFKKGEVTATLEEGNNQVKLTITAASKNEEKQSKTKSKNGTEAKEVRSSFAQSTLVRSFILPSSVDTSSYKATHKNGVFSLVFPLKKEAVKKTIEIKIDKEKEEK